MRTRPGNWNRWRWGRRNSSNSGKLISHLTGQMDLRTTWLFGTISTYTIFRLEVQTQNYHKKDSPNYNLKPNYILILNYPHHFFLLLPQKINSVLYVNANSCEIIFGRRGQGDRVWNDALPAVIKFDDSENDGPSRHFTTQTYHHNYVRHIILCYYSSELVDENHFV